jgi:hypothetical protein
VLLYSIETIRSLFVRAARIIVFNSSSNIHTRLFNCRRRNLIPQQQQQAQQAHPKTQTHPQSSSLYCMLLRLTRIALIDSRSSSLYFIHRRSYFTNKTFAKKQMKDASISNNNNYNDSLQPLVQAQQSTTDEQQKLEEDFSEVRAIHFILHIIICIRCSSR